MTKEDYVKNLIKQSGHSLKSFSEYINLPYTTFLSMLKNGLGGSSVDNVIKVCQGLGISIESLVESESQPLEQEPLVLSKSEQQLIKNYRNKKEMQVAVDKILGIVEDCDGE